MTITIDAEYRSHLVLGVLTLAGLDADASLPAFDRELERTSARLRARFAAGEPGQDPRIAAVRSLFHRLGIDPTKRRPSSEALLRRTLRGERWTRVHPLVDACNLMSLELLLPIGLYDLDRLEPPLELRPGRAGETYAGIGREPIHFEGRAVVCDRAGPFGSPISDSERTKVQASTRRALWVVFFPAAIPRIERSTALDRCAGFLRPLAAEVEIEP
jgi:DNA/RNA-binding domain of Phe-tRNA-synthetase-like protein